MQRRVSLLANRKILAEPKLIHLKLLVIPLGETWASPACIFTLKKLITENNYEVSNHKKVIPASVAKSWFQSHFNYNISVNGDENVYVSFTFISLFQTCSIISIIRNKINTQAQEGKNIMSGRLLEDRLNKLCQWKVESEREKRYLRKKNLSVKDACENG